LNNTECLNKSTTQLEQVDRTCKRARVAQRVR